MPKQDYWQLGYLTPDNEYHYIDLLKILDKEENCKLSLLDIIESTSKFDNEAYYKLLLFYNGLLSEEEVVFPLKIIRFSLDGRILGAYTPFYGHDDDMASIYNVIESYYRYGEKGYHNLINKVNSISLSILKKDKDNNMLKSIVERFKPLLDEKRGNRFKKAATEHYFKISCFFRGTYDPTDLKIDVESEIKGLFANTLQEPLYNHIERKSTGSKFNSSGFYDVLELLNEIKQSDAPKIPAPDELEEIKKPQSSYPRGRRRRPRRECPGTK